MDFRFFLKRSSLIVPVAVSGTCLLFDLLHGRETKPATQAVLLRYADGIVRLGVSPRSGRIVSFGKIGGKDLLWRNIDSEVNIQKRDGETWVNYGGDKIWPTVQYSWSRIYGRDGNWPPDKAIDGGQWNIVERGKRRIVMESLPSDELHVKIRREIIVEDEKSAVTIRNTVEQLSRSPFPVCIWSITQVIPPRYCLLDVNKEQPSAAKLFIDFYGNRANIQVLQSGALLKFIPQKEKKAKVGTFGRWIAAVYPDCMFRQSTGYDPAGCYPDKASLECLGYNRMELSGSEAWSPHYVELESLSPSRHLQPGERISNVVQWEIIDIPGGDGAEIPAAAH